MLLLLDTKNQLTYEAMIYRGSWNSMVMRTGELLREALCCNAASIIATNPFV